MYCLEKFQDLLSDFLDIDIKTLPKLEDNLKKEGVYRYPKRQGGRVFLQRLKRVWRELPTILSQAKEAVEQIRKDIQRDFNITPIAEFGTNYAEFYRDGANAIAKILREKQGQVAGAFYKEGLGDIDVVWGDSHFGLQHILERRTQDFIKEGLSEAEAKAKAREFVESIPKIIESGKVVKDDKGRLRIELIIL